MKEGFEQDNTTSDLKDNERLFETKITIDVLGHLVGKGDNQDQPKVVSRENIIDVKINREYTFIEPIDKKYKKIY